MNKSARHQQRDADASCKNIYNNNINNTTINITIKTIAGLLVLERGCVAFLAIRARQMFGAVFVVF